jgi:hypothetical protein
MNQPVNKQQITSWLEGDRDYYQGLLLFVRYAPGKLIGLVQLLSLKEDEKNRKTLVYELKKLIKGEEQKGTKEVKSIA